MGPQAQLRDLTARFCLSFLHFAVPLLNRGRREGRAPTAPVDPVRGSTRASRAPKRSGKTLQVQPRHPGLPRAMALRLIRALPGERPLLSPLPAPHRQCRIDARVAAPGPHDFAVRSRTCRRVEDHLTPQASIATRATFRDDREAPLMAARAESISTANQNSGKAKYFRG